MAPLSKYAVALTFFLSSISAIPLDVVNDVSRSNDASMLKNLVERDGTLQELPDIPNAPYILSSDVGNLTAHFGPGLEKRQSGDCGERPANSICGPDFVDMGNKGWGPALAAMPQWNHARLPGGEKSCYPENAANANNDGINPGLPRGDGDLPVGNKCVNPSGDQGYSGPLMKSVPFPVYVDGAFCPGDNSWRITYSLYYPKDMTHRHDWERVVVVFTKGTTGGGDWWERKAFILAQHSGFNTLPWSSTTSHDDPYSSSPTRGNNGAHPRVFMGLYKHASYNEAKRSCLGQGCQSGDQEYRSNNWQFTPVLSDIRNGVVDAPWNYPNTTPPTEFQPQVCGKALP